MPLPSGDDGPRIALWGGDRQTVGAVGHPQRWVNVLGRATGRIVRLTSCLNDGPVRMHWVGPDLRRLTEPGDFNIELDRADLRPGLNRLTLEARDTAGRMATSSVSLHHHDDTHWPMPWRVDWNDPDSHCIVDGRWHHTADGLRTTGTGYDRMLAFGDAGWRGYALRTTVTLHAAAEPLAQAPTFGVAHVAMAAHWPGHGNDMHQPHLAWYPLGVTCELQLNPRLEGCRFRMLFGAGAGAMTQEAGPGRDLAFDRAYGMRLRVEPSGTGTVYSARIWPACEAEPSGWALICEKPRETVPGGSAALLAHNTDVTFGATSVDAI